MPYPDSLSQDLRKSIEAIVTLGQKGDTLGFESYHNQQSSNNSSPHGQLWLDLALADAYLEVYDFTKAFDVVQRTADAAQVQGEQELQALALVHTALIHEWLTRKEDCKRYLDEAKNLIQSSPMPTAEAWYYVRLASYHRHFGNAELGRQYALRGYKLGKKHGIGRAHIDGAIMLGILSDEGDEKITYFDKAARALAYRQHYYSAVSQYGNTMISYLKLGKAIEALRYRQVCDSLIRLMANPDPGLLSTYHKTLSDAWVQVGNMDSAYVHLNRSRNYLAQLQFTFDQEYVNESEISFAIERQEDKLSAAKQQNKLYLIVGLVTLALFLAVLGLYRRATWQKGLLYDQTLEIASANSELQSANLLQKTLLTDVHHRVKNNLQLITSLLAIRSEVSGNLTMEPFIADISQKIKSISLMHEHLYQNQRFESVQMRNYLRDLIEYFVSAYEGTTTINYELDVEPIDLNLETVIPLGLLVTELISNSLKHATSSDQGLELSVSLAMEQSDLYELKYADNGPGLPEGRLSAGHGTMGATIIQSMVRQLAATSHAFNGIEGGAHFSIVFGEKNISSF